MNTENKDIEIEQNGIHNKFKNLIIPAGLALYTRDDTTHHHLYDVIHRNEPVHDSLYDRLLELASYNSTIDNEKENKRNKKEKEKKEQEDKEQEDKEQEDKEPEDKENITLRIQPVSPPANVAAVITEVFKTNISKKTKRNKSKPATIMKHTRRRKRVVVV